MFVDTVDKKCQSLQILLLFPNNGRSKVKQLIKYIFMQIYN